MNLFTCPICKERFEKSGNSLVCSNRHCFDLSKRGYVNLLRPSKSGGVRHGDDKLMVESRKNFLNAGFYAPLAKTITEILREKAPKNATVLDAGCGEGYYTVETKKALQTESVYGVDVSRDAIHAASLRDKSLRLAVASIFDLPVPKDSIDVLLNLFAPYDSAEFSRVLKEGGLLVRVFPAERHLWELKCAVYDTPYENEIDSFLLDGFEMLEKKSISFPLNLTTQTDIDALFKMTPYYYKTSREGQARLSALQSLQTHAEFYLAVYQKSTK
jgi:23S rRNA (guanine745-N1)-methyltransferase